VSSVIVGQLVARTGRYKVWPVVGSSLVLLGMVLMTTIGTGTSLATVSAYLVLVGIGMGVMFQIYIIAAQNAVPVTQIGVVTGQLNFYRSMGGSFAVAGLGALLTSRLGTELVDQLGRAGERIDPNQVVQSGSAHLSPIAAIGLALAFALQEKPLRKQAQAPSAQPATAQD
jgi:MFS family permease